MQGKNYKIGKRQGVKQKPRGCNGKAGGLEKPAREALDKDVRRLVFPSNAAV